MKKDPIRIQRHRMKGWRTPPDTRYVGRPTVFGNPFDWRACSPDIGSQEWAKCVSVMFFREWINGTREGFEARRLQLLDRLSELQGKNLSCWCGINEPCHADVLLAIVNGRCS